MKSLLRTLRSPKGVVMVVAMLILLAVTAVGLGMITGAALSSSIAKNYKYKLMSFYAADGQMTVLSQQVLDSNEANWKISTGGGGTGDSIWPITVDSYGEQQSGNEATKSIDNNTGTRWGTNNNLANCWIKYNLGASYSVNKVKLMFERTNVTYPIEIDVGSTNAWAGNASITTANTYWTQSIPATTGQYVTVKLTAKTSANDAWFSFYEFRIYRALATAAQTVFCDTPSMGDFKVIRYLSMDSGSTMCFHLSTKAYDSLNRWGVAFETPLKQYVERAGSVQQPYPDSTYFPITYFDFHSNGSNPEFNPGTNPPNVAYVHMVKDSLDASGLPQRGDSCLWSHYINKWWRPWRQSALGQENDSLRPNYDWSGKKAGYSGDTHVNYDTTFKDTVINDSLKFTLIDQATGTYEYACSTCCPSLDGCASTGVAGKPVQGFFPLDGKGFGAEPGTRDWNYYDYTTGTVSNSGHNIMGDHQNWSGIGGHSGCPGDSNHNYNHNYSFSAHLSRTFTYRTGLTYTFRGDDDLWVFINGKLAMDLGGLHNKITSTISLDALTSWCYLVQGQTATLDVFFCERQASGSNIIMTTNLFFLPQRFTKQRHWQRDYGNLQ